jgi:hypothetical protein
VLRLTIIALAFALTSAACAKEATLDVPEDALDAFAAALASGDPDLVWAMMSEENRQKYQDAVETLREMDAMIAYLQSSEQDEFRVMAGVDRLDTITDGRRLFHTHYESANIPDSEPVIGGLGAVEVVEDADTATITTRAGQTIIMHRGDDGIWRVHAPIDALIDEQLAPIAANRVALRDTVALFGTGVDLREELVRYGVLEASALDAVERDGDGG